jgi:hypothetical protein
VARFILDVFLPPSGKLVTAKYIPPEKYHKWFAAATNAKDHIFPSS